MVDPIFKEKLYVKTMTTNINGVPIKMRSPPARLFMDVVFVAENLNKDDISEQRRKLVMQKLKEIVMECVLEPRITEDGKDDTLKFDDIDFLVVSKIFNELAKYIQSNQEEVKDFLEKKKT